MEDKFGYDAVDVALDRRAVKYLLSGKTGVRDHEGINTFWYAADGDLFYYAKLNCGVDDDRDCSLFALADYCTLIPYGDEGYAVFEEFIKKEEGVSAAEWRYNAFLKILGKSAQKFTKAQLARIKRFFENRNLKEVHSNDIDEVTAGLLRARHRAEAVSATVRNKPSYGGSTQEWDDKFAMIADELPQRDVMPMDELLSYFSEPAPLGEEEKNFVLEAKERIERIIKNAED